MLLGLAPRLLHKKKMSRRGRSRTLGSSVGVADGETLTSSELPYFICDRSAKINKSGFEGFKGTDDENDDAEYLDAQVTFTVDHPITLIGVKIASEIHRNPNSYCDDDDTKNSETYEEEAFVYLLEGSTEIADSHIDDEVQYRSMIDAMFPTPPKCEKDVVYKVKVLCSVDGAYPLAKCANKVVKDGVTFTFNVGNPQDSFRDGIIRSLYFKKL